MYPFNPEQNKRLIEIYPYLQPRNVWSDKIPEDYDYSYIRGDHEIPEGWMRLFLLYCKAIRPVLVNADYLDKFRFSQLKEKYGSLRLYNFGYPSEMSDLEWLYSGYSEFVCQRCGKMAKISTSGWVEQLCEDCYNPFKNDYPADRVVKHRSTRIRTWGPDGSSVRVLSYRDVNKEYMKCIKMTDKKFFEYITKEENYAPEKYRETRAQSS